LLQVLLSAAALRLFNERPVDTSLASRRQALQPAADTLAAPRLAAWQSMDALDPAPCSKLAMAPHSALIQRLPEQSHTSLGLGRPVQL
jgi:hypothetical protein